MCYPEQQVVVLAIGKCLVEYDYLLFKMTKMIKTGSVFAMEKVNYNAFLTGDFEGNIKFM